MRTGEHQFERLAQLLARPEWLGDPRLAGPWGWVDHLAGVIRPAVEQWAASRTKLEAATALANAGIAAAPGNSAEDLVKDPHVLARRMLVEIPRRDGVEQPVLVSGNPVKLSDSPPDVRRSPLLGEHTEEILGEVLGYSEREIAALKASGALTAPEKPGRADAA